MCTCMCTCVQARAGRQARTYLRRPHQARARSEGEAACLSSVDQPGSHDSRCDGLRLRWGLWVGRGTRSTRAVGGRVLAAAARMKRDSSEARREGEPGGFVGAAGLFVAWTWKLERKRAAGGERWCAASRRGPLVAVGVGASKKCKSKGKYGGVCKEARLLILVDMPEAAESHCGRGPAPAHSTPRPCQKAWDGRGARAARSPAVQAGAQSGPGGLWHRVHRCSCPSPARPATPETSGRQPPYLIDRTNAAQRAATNQKCTTDRPTDRPIDRSIDPMGCCLIDLDRSDVRQAGHPTAVGTASSPARPARRSRRRARRRDKRATSASKFALQSALPACLRAGQCESTRYYIHRCLAGSL